MLGVRALRTYPFCICISCRVSSWLSFLSWFFSLPQESKGFNPFRKPNSSIQLSPRIYVPSWWSRNWSKHYATKALQLSALEQNHNNALFILAFQLSACHLKTSLQCFNKGTLSPSPPHPLNSIQYILRYCISNTFLSAYN